MRTNFRHYIGFLLLIFFLGIPVNTFAQAGMVVVSGSINPLDATNLVITEPGDGTGTCVLNWDNSATSNVEISRIFIDSGFSLTSLDLPVPIIDGGQGAGNAESTVYTGLVVGWTYIFNHVSLVGPYQSPGIWDICIPTSALPAPAMVAEPATTEGLSNTVYWTNGGIDDPTLECNVQLSTTDLNIDPLTYQQESGWTACPTSTTTYDYTFNSLVYNTTYFYHVQSRTVADGSSPFSNVVFSTQIDSGGGTTPPDDGGGGGGRPPDPDPECGDGTLDSGETCDDGNTVSGDGCSATCDIEHPAAEECGNGLIETGETCDDGNLISGDGCNAVCQVEEEEDPECGDGEINQPEEECDDGNILPGDGCNEVCELEVVEVRFEIKGAPQFRVPHTSDPNLSLNSQFLVHKPSIANTDSVQIKLDEFGEAVYEGEIVTGTYEFGLNGEAHNTKLIRGINIDPTTEVVVLDFTYAETVELIAGDTVDNNYINGVDMSKLIQQYREQGAEVLSDLNREGYVNGIDASILITNYRKTGEAF